MSEENVELVRRAYKGFADVGVAPLAELAHPSVEWIPDRRVGEGPIQGRDKVSEFFTDRAAMFGEMEYEVEQTWDLGEQVLAIPAVPASLPKLSCCD